MKIQNADQAREYLSQFPGFAFTTDREAKACLNNVYKKEVELPEAHEATMFIALQMIATANMGREHANDPKRAQRATGKNQRKKRTGSRR